MDMHNETNQFTIEIPSTVQTVFCDKTMTTEIGQDFILPDYQPEMRKILRVIPSILPPSRFLGVGEAEFAGNVSFSVLYLGADGALYTATPVIPYTFRLPIEGSDRFADDRPIGMDIAISAESVIPRLHAPRKLNIKCRLNARLLGRYDEETDMRIGGDHTESAVEKREHTATCARILYAVGEALELSDEVAIPSGEGELRVIDNSGAVQMTETALTEEGVFCRGELYWKLTFTRDPLSSDPSLPQESISPAASGMLETVTRRIPFSTTVELPAAVAPGSCETMAHGTCAEIETRVEDGKVLCVATIVPEVQVMGRDKVTFTRDCFSATHSAECSMRKYAYSRPIACFNGNVTESGSVALSEIGIPKSAVLSELTGTASFAHIACERGHLTMHGECNYRLLYQTASGEVAVAEFRLPIRYELPCEGSSEAQSVYELNARAVLLNSRARQEGEQLSVDAEWAIAASVTAVEEIEAVDEIRFGAPIPPREGEYILCYPDRDDTLWRIAKRYHTPLRPLAALNRLPGSADPASPQSLEDVHFLMIH